MTIEANFALWVLPFVLPLCLYVAWTDLKFMRITNKAVVTLAVVFVGMGIFLLPLDTYLWALAQFAIVLVLGFLLSTAGVVGAGDAKFAAAAAPFVASGDLRLIMVIMASALLTAFASHRIAKFTPLRRLAPNWESWERKGDFPMGFALGPGLAAYLILGALYGA